MPFFKPIYSSTSGLAIALSTGLLIGLATLQTSAAEPTSAQAADEATMMKMKKAIMEKGRDRQSANDDISDAHVCNPNGVALAGIDVVSYHKPTGPLMGNSDYAAVHKGLTYRFISEDHLNQFVATPARFLPSYMGWCATSLAAGALTCPNPLNYKLEDGKLLLFETTGFTNGQDLWNVDPLDYRRRADNHRDGFLAASHGASDVQEEQEAPESAQL